MNKIAIVSMMRNEDDIVESFARHALKIADFLIVTDHNSTDKTRRILESLRDEGLPIIIRSFDSVEHRQEETTNIMILQAIELGADIILPLDADEFLIKLDGNSNDIRQIFQNLDSEKCYLIRWLNYGFLDKDKFILSRPLAFMQKNDLSKAFVGSRAYLKNDLFVVRGNHMVVKKSSLYGTFKFDNVAVPINEEFQLMNMHVPVRSRAQFESKILRMGLTHVARFAKNSFYGNQYRDDARSISGYDNSQIAIPDSPAIDLSRYRGECVLKYTDGIVDQLQNIYRLAEDIADKYNRLQTLIQRIPVSIFVLHYGNAEKTISTLDSIFKQTYEPIEIFVMPVVASDLERLINWGESISNYLELIDYDLPAAIENSRGKYLQFVTAGDILEPKTIEKFLCVMMPQENIRAAVYMPSQQNQDVIFIYYRNILQLAFDQNLAFDVGISSMFYRREFVPDSLKFFIEHNINAHGSRLFLESIWGGMVAVLRENLIDRKSAKVLWTDEDRKIFEQDMLFLRSKKIE